MNFSFDILSQITSGANLFSPAESRLATFILSNPDFVLPLSISELADSSGVSVATVSRFCKRLSLDGYSEFRMELAKAMTFNSNAIQADSNSIETNDSVEALIKKVYSIHSYTLSKSMENLDPKSVEAVVALMNTANDVSFIGAGSMLLIAMIAKIQFMQVSSKFKCELDVPIQALGASLMNAQSVTVVFSYTGSTRDIIEVSKLAKQNGSKIIAITRYSHSPLAEIADIILICGVSEGPFQMGSVPVKSGMLYIIDVLYTEYCRTNPEIAGVNKELTSAAVIGKIHPLKKL